MRLIGINGLKTSGKDTTFSLVYNLTSLDGQVARRAGFADKLKIMAARALGFDRPDLELIALMDSFKEDAIFSVNYTEPANGEAQRNSLHELTGRQYLQWFGENARKVFGDTFWIDQVLPQPEFLSEVPSDLRGASERIINWSNMDDRYPGADILCITDVRYPNEAERIKALGGEVWEIVRPGLVSDGHSTEQELPRSLVDYIVLNDGTINDLRDEVRRVL